MPRPKKQSTKGIGKCGDPDCSESRAPNHFLCSWHAKKIAKVRKAFEKEDSERITPFSKSKDRSIVSEQNKKAIRAPRKPTCCWLGCYETRTPPNAYCLTHDEYEEEMEYESAAI